MFGGLIEFNILIYARQNKTENRTIKKREIGIELSNE